MDNAIGCALKSYAFYDTGLKKAMLGLVCFFHQAQDMCCNFWVELKKQLIL
jgi:hypothetical protein